MSEILAEKFMYFLSRVEFFETCLLFGTRGKRIHKGSKYGPKSAILNPPAPLFTLRQNCVFSCFWKISSTNCLSLVYDLQIKRYRRCDISRQFAGPHLISKQNSYTGCRKNFYIWTHQDDKWGGETIDVFFSVEQKRECE